METVQSSLLDLIDLLKENISDSIFDNTFQSISNITNQIINCMATKVKNFYFIKNLTSSRLMKIYHKMN